MRKTLIAAGALLVAGCAHRASSQQVAGPDGTSHQLVECGQIDVCYSAAAELCQPREYTIVDSGSKVRSVKAANGPLVFTDYHMLIRCK